MYRHISCSKLNPYYKIQCQFLINQSLWCHKTVIPLKSVCSRYYWAIIMGWISQISPYSNSKLSVGDNSRGLIPGKQPCILCYGAPWSSQKPRPCSLLAHSYLNPLSTIAHNPFWTKPRDRPKLLKCPALCPHPFSLGSMLGGVPLPTEASLSKQVLSQVFPTFKDITPLGLRMPSTHHCHNLPIPSLGQLCSFPICSQNNNFF